MKNGAAIIKRFFGSASRDDARGGWRGNIVECISYSEGVLTKKRNVVLLQNSILYEPHPHPTTLKQQQQQKKKKKKKTCTGYVMTELFYLQMQTLFLYTSDFSTFHMGEICSVLNPS